MTTDIELLDKAVYMYLYSINDKVCYSVTSKAHQTITKNSKHQDKIPLTFISFYRSPNFDIDMGRYNFTMTQLGDNVRLSGDDYQRTARYVQSLPINVTYQVDLWAAKETSVQELAIDLITKIYMDRQVLIADMNPDGEPARFHIQDVTWVDNSDLELENEKGKIYRHTVTFTVPTVIKLTKDIPTTKFTCVPVDIYE